MGRENTYVAACRKLRAAVAVVCPVELAEYRTARDRYLNWTGTLDAHWVTAKQEFDDATFALASRVSVAIAQQEKADE